MEAARASFNDSVMNDFTDDSRKKQREAGLPTVLLLSALIYMGLYGFFIFGNAVYMYSDVGSDSLSSSYPIITMLARLYREKQFSFYTLSSGLGSDTSATFLQYLNPLKFLLLNFGKESFPFAVLLFVFLQHVFTAVFAYGFFKSLLKAKRPAVFAALIWGYTSYIVVWGQNYSFGICVLLFTASMFFLQLLLNRPSRLYFMLLTFTFALFIASNYYFFYMTGVFTIFYVIFFTLSVRGKDNRFVRMIKRLLTLALSALMAMAVSCAAILPIVMNFLGSARTGDTASFDLRALLTPYGMKAYFTFLGRFFSASIMGSGSDFTGYLNFYETALLFTSSLFFFAGLYVLFRKKSVIQTILVTVLVAGMLFCPAAGKLLTFNIFSQRYSFMICFVEVIAIGFLLKDILSLDMKTVPAFYISALGAPLITAGVLYLLYMRRTALGYTLNKFAFLAAVASIAVWTFWLILAGLMKNKRPATAVGLLLLAAELLITNQAAVYDRAYLTKTDYKADYFNDGTQDAVAKIKTSDSGLYRINTSTEYDFANEGLVDGFNATTTYSNTNPASIVSLSRAFGNYQLSSNFFIAGYEQYYLYTLLAGKYLVCDLPDNASDSIEPPCFKETDRTETNVTFENVNALPFGYLYHEEMDGADFVTMNSYEKMRALAKSYVLTEEIDETKKKDADDHTKPAEGDTVLDLIPKIHTVNNCDLAPVGTDKIRVRSVGPDAYFFLDISDYYSEDAAETQFLHLAAERESLKQDTDLEVFILTSEHPDLGDCISTTMPLNFIFNDSVILLPDHTTLLRIDLPDDGELVFSAMEFITSKGASEDFKELQSTEITDISFENDTYSATVKNPKTDAMLCIPLLYTSNWNATVNGSKVQVFSINGGMCGITLPKGTCEVKMTYEIPNFGIAVKVSAISAGVCLLIGIIPPFRRKKEEDGDE